MSRNKKSRKTGAIGIAKSNDYSTKVKQKKKSPKGKPSGSRQHIAEGKTRSSQARAQKDPRHGSKKSIPLLKETGTKTQYSTPKQELTAIENDARLIALLDKQDRGQKLSVEQACYLEQKLERHAVLCSLLGIKPEQDDENDDPFDRLDAISIDDFTDSSSDT